MKTSGSHFRFNRSQRNGIFFLILIIILLQIGYFLIDTNPYSDPADSLKITRLQQRFDSLQKAAEIRKDTLFPFNPNYLTDYKAYRIGLSPEQADRLFAFRKTGKFVNSPKEFQKVTQINDSLLRILTPYFKFPEWVKQKTPKKPSKIIITTNDLNRVTADELAQLPQIGKNLAGRIVKYRSLLKGYSVDAQLYEVYGLDSAQAKAVLHLYRVIEKPKIEKVNINTATFKEVLRLPYIDYKLTKRIFNYLNKHRPLGSVEQLKEIDSFPLEKFDRINLYLTAE